MAESSYTIDGTAYASLFQSAIHSPSVALRYADGSLDPSTVSRTNPLPVRDWLLEAALGNVTGAEVIHKFGRNNDVDTSVEDIWSPTGLYSWPTAASTLEVISSDANDTAAGSGAQSITIEGLDISLNAITENVATNGVSASSATSASFFRVNRAFVNSCGTYMTTVGTGGNAGDITIRISGAGATQAQIDFDVSIPFGQTQLSRYSVPTGKSAFILEAKAKVDSSKTARIMLFRRESATDVTPPVQAPRLLAQADGATGTVPFIKNPMGPFAAGTDLWFSAIADAINTVVAVEFELLVL